MGGEPLLHPEWEKFAAFFSERKCYVSIATNGTLLEKNAEKILASHVDELIVSLDGTEDIHDKIRGSKNAYLKLLAGIKSINKARKTRQMKPKIIVNCTITEDNIYVLPDVVKICHLNDVDEVVFQLPMWMSERTGIQYSAMCYRFFGKSGNSWKGFVQRFNLNIEYLADFFMRCCEDYPGYVRLFNTCIKDKDDIYRYFNTEDSVAKHNCCSVIADTICVEANGDIVTCPDFPDVRCGNISSMKYSEYINQSNRIQYIELFREYGGFPICKRCCHYI